MELTNAYLNEQTKLLTQQQDYLREGFNITIDLNLMLLKNQGIISQQIYNNTYLLFLHACMLTALCLILMSVMCYLDKFMKYLENDEAVRHGAYVKISEVVEA